jgi:hypothetical protein
MKIRDKEQPSAASITRNPSAEAPPPTNIVPLPVEAMKAYPMATGMSEEDINARIAKVYWIKEELMKEGVHYGYTPRNKNGDTYDKPSLYQPGAQLLNVIFQNAPSFKHEVQRFNEKPGHFLFNLDCTLTNYPTGMSVGAGVGGASTGESRWKDTPPLSSYNSVFKIGAKRAYVAATISCVGVSEIFTQDLEDMTDDELPGNDSGSRQLLPEPPQRRLRRGEVKGLLEKAAFGNGSFWGLVEGHNYWTKEQTLGELMLKLRGEWVRLVHGPESESKANTHQLFAIEKSQAPTNAAPPAEPERKGRRNR